jgi:SAM-dependent methyltransferase
VLELAIGTGRIGLKLANRGLPLDGIEASTELVDLLRAKPGGEALDVTIGDFADVAVPGTYGLVFVVFNTLFNLTTQDEQVRCFRNVADHLEDDGLFVVECYVPSAVLPQRARQYVATEVVEQDEISLDVGLVDPVTQRVDKSHVVFTPAGIKFYPVVMRYAWPAEIDLMARLAGLRLKERWSGWKLEPFTAGSESHVSVYGR